MQTDREARIRDRAHKIWQNEGHVEGKDTEHWHRAEAEIDAEDTAAKPVRVAPKPTGTTPAASKKPSTSGAGKSATTTPAATTRGRSRTPVGSDAS